MKLLSGTLLSLVALSATPVMALDFGNGFSLVGDVELEYLSDSGSDDGTFGFLDMTLGWRSQAGGGLGFGADVAFVNFEDFDDGDGLQAIWGGLVLTTGYGEFTVGSPRPLLQTMIVSPDVGGVRIFDLELSSVTGSLLEILKLSTKVDIYGVSFKGSSGDLTYGAAYHQIDDSGFDLDAIELAMTYQLGKTRFQAGIELLDAGSEEAEKLLLGATYVDDRWSAGVLLSSASNGGSDLNSVKLFGDYSLGEAFKVGVQMLRLDQSGSGSETYYGATGQYGFGSGGFAELGVFDSSDTGNDALYQASVGFRF